MPIRMSHRRAITGNDLFVEVTAPTGKLITSVKCLLDGLGLPNEPFCSPPVPCHSHNHPQAGGAGPFQKHTHKVTAYYDDGSDEPGQDDWVDPI